MLAINHICYIVGFCQQKHIIVDDNATSCHKDIGSHPKKVFSPDIGVQILNAEHRTLNTFIKESLWIKRIKKKAAP